MKYLTFLRSVHPRRALEAGRHEARGPARRVREAGHAGGEGAEVARQLHQPRPRLVRGVLLEEPPRAVLRAVVDEHELELWPRGTARERRRQVGDVLLVVIDGDDDRDLSHGTPARRRRPPGPRRRSAAGTGAGSGAAARRSPPPGTIPDRTPSDGMTAGDGAGPGSARAS